MRLISFFAEPALPIGFVFAVVAFVPDHFAIAFEGHNVRSDTVEEPAVVAADDGATGKAFQSFFQGPKGVDVEVVRRLVEDDEVGALFQHPGQMHAVALAA